MKREKKRVIMNKPSIYQALVELQESGEPGALCTLISSSGSTPRHQGSKMLVYSDGQIIGTVGGGEVENRVIEAALEAMFDGQAQKLSYAMVDPSRGDPGVCGGQVEIYIEPILPPPHLIVIGGGHVGKSVAHLAKWLGFHVSVSDDRVEFCTPEANPDADGFYPISMTELPQHAKINSQTYLVLTTRGLIVDVPGLPALLNTAAAYIGVIGSKRRWTETVKKLRENGLTEEKIARVTSPIGLEINAETPDEIAVSIMAEIIMLRNGGTGKPMSK
jgi:xanthine dehydrogenase accessory factor